MARDKRVGAGQGLLVVSKPTVRCSFLDDSLIATFFGFRRRRAPIRLWLNCVQWFRGHVLGNL